MIAASLASFAKNLQPTEADLQLADRSLLDTLAVMFAARTHPLARRMSEESAAVRLGVLGHVLDFDDLHMNSTTHISVVTVAATLLAGGDATAYLAGAGVMARLGAALAWPHYARGWHATCTAGASAAAASAARAWGLSEERTATAIALAIPASGGVQRAFGTDAKSIQVGFAIEAGLRAARLASKGVTADLRAVDAWFDLVGGTSSALVTDEPNLPAIPEGLAIKLFPCCYAMQRPIVTMQRALDELCGAAAKIHRIRIVTPEATVVPLIHHRPTSALEGKFSLEYALAAAALDSYPGFASFSDDAVNRPAAQRLIERVEIELIPGGSDLLAGSCAVEVSLDDGSVRAATVTLPPGAPLGPPVEQILAQKVVDCTGSDHSQVIAAGWAEAGRLCRNELLSPGAHTQ